MDIHLFCACELATIAIIQTTASPDVNTGHDQVYRGTKSSVTASDPSGKHRPNFHRIVKAWNNFRVPSEQATDSGRVWWTGEGGGVHGSVEAGTSPDFDIRKGVGRTLRNGDIGFRVEGAVAP